MANADTLNPMRGNKGLPGDYFKPGDPVSASRFNELFSMAIGQPIWGQANPGMALPFDEHTLAAVNATGADLIEHSIVGIADGTVPWAQPLISQVYATGWNKAGNPMLLCTNGTKYISAGQVGDFRPIGHSRPVELVISGATPSPGNICGKSLTANGIEANGVGFICLSGSYVSGGATRAWFAKYPGSANFVGKVTTKITKKDGTTHALGTGVVQIFYRDPTDSNKLKAALNPVTLSSGWSCTVWNYLGKEFAVDEFVQVVETPNIGLVVIGGAGDSFYAKVTDDIPPRDLATSIMGTGKVNLMYRDDADSNKLKADTSAEFDVWNPGPDWFAVGDEIQIFSDTRIGLTCAIKGWGFGTLTQALNYNTCTGATFNYAARGTSGSAGCYFSSSLYNGKVYPSFLQSSAADNIASGTIIEWAWDGQYIRLRNARCS